MKVLIDSIAAPTVSTTQANTLSLKTLRLGTFVKSLVFEVDIAIPLGGAPAAHSLEAVAALFQRISTSQGVLKINIDGRRLLTLWQLSHQRRWTGMRDMTAADTTFRVSVPIDMTALESFPGDYNTRKSSKQLLGQKFSVNLQNLFAAADRAGCTFTNLAVFAEYSPKGPSEENNQVITIGSVSEIESDVFAITDFQPTMVCLESRADYDTLSMSGSSTSEDGKSVDICEDNTADQIDQADADYILQPAQSTGAQTVIGNPLAQDIETLAAGVFTEVTKLDMRNDWAKLAASPIRFKFNGKTADFGYFYKGVYGTV